MDFFKGLLRMRLSLFVLYLFAVADADAQTPQPFTVKLQSDLIRSDHVGFFTKIQGGLEGEYRVNPRWGGTAGLEWWSEKGLIPAAGLRFYPVDEAFVRLRGLWREDVAIGGGFGKPLSDRFRLEAMTDYHIIEGLIAIRAGLAWQVGNAR